MDLLLDRLEFGEAGQRDLDRRQQLRLAERLDEVGDDPRLPGALDQMLLAIRRQQQHRRDASARQFMGGGDPVHPGILMSMITRSGRKRWARSTAIAPSLPSPTTS